MTYAIQKLSVVLPVYNEVDNLLPLLEELENVLSVTGLPHEIILVDDGSNDGSSPLVETLAAENPAIRAILFSCNCGQTAAMAAGIDAATGDVILLMDADRQNDPADIPGVLAKITEGYDVVSGWRKNRQDPFLRSLLSRVANRLIRVLSSVPLHDFGCSLKAYRRDILQNISLHGEMHRFIPILTSWMGAKLVEVPVNHRPRVAGVSKYGFNRIFKVIFDIVILRFLGAYQTKPIHFFGRLSLAALGFTLTLGVLGAVSARCWPGQALPVFSLLVSLWVGVLVSVQFFVFGMLAEINIRNYYQSTGKKPYVIRKVVN